MKRTATPQGLNSFQVAAIGLMIGVCVSFGARATNSHALQGPASSNQQPTQDVTSKSMSDGPASRALDPDQLRSQRIAIYSGRVAAFHAFYARFIPKRARVRSTRVAAGPSIRPGTSDLECLSQAIYYEARSEPEQGQIQVAQVVVNRARSGRFPPTICGVVFQGAPRRGCQFSFACEGSRQANSSNAAAWQASRLIAQRVLNGDVSGNKTVDHYHADYVRPSWASNMERVAQIGRHIFFNSKVQDWKPSLPRSYPEVHQAEVNHSDNQGAIDGGTGAN